MREPGAVGDPRAAVWQQFLRNAVALDHFIEYVRTQQCYRLAGTAQGQSA